MANSIANQYKSYVSKRIMFIIILFVALIILALISLVAGPADISLKDLPSVLFGDYSGYKYNIIVNIRLVRIIAAVLSGIALAVSGVVVQSLLRNPLASPFTLGISGSSAFGAAFAIIVLGAGTSFTGSNDVSVINNPYIVTISAFVWSLISVFIILLLSRYKGAGPEVVILSGIIISSLFGAGISAMQYFADSVQLSSIVFWSFGDIGRASTMNISILSVVLLVVMIFFISQSWNYKALQSGDEHAKSLGLKPGRIRLIGMAAASLVTAIVVSFFGIIAFVGLAAPHIVRRIIGGDEQFLLPSTAIFGGFFLLLSDTLARTIISPVILPVGILTSFVGAPLFLFLLIRGKDYWS